MHYLLVFFNDRQLVANHIADFIQLMTLLDSFSIANL